MMTLDHVGDKEAMVDAQLGQQPLARTTETLPFPRIFENSGGKSKGGFSTHCDRRWASTLTR